MEGGEDAGLLRELNQAAARAVRQGPRRRLRILSFRKIPIRKRTGEGGLGGTRGD
jgi:hypothetical protein